MTLRRAAAALAAAAVLFAACTSDDSTVESSDERPEADAEHNEADVTFAQRMIPHHEQAVEMAQLATERAGDERVKDLAARIEAAQAPEIEQMEGWLEAWGEELPDDEGMDMEGMDMSGSGMMTDDEMVELEAASGTEFDVMFLEMMIGHHRGAVEMAETEIEAGQFPDALALAEAVKSTQEAEIAEMEALVEELGG